MNQRHPEQQLDEIFIGNSSLCWRSSWRTLRIGDVAFALDGTVVVGATPAFVQMSEIEQAIRDAEMDMDRAPLQALLDAQKETS